jgi:hypothetical protein
MELVYGDPMPENKRPAAARPDTKNLPALLTEALDEPVTATIDGKHREITSEAVVTQLVNIFG